MFNRMFGGPKKAAGQVSGKATVVTVDAIQKLGETEELLVKRRNVLELKINAELDKAREHTRLKNKRAALMCLKQKKMYENQLEQVENNMLRVSEQQMMLENQRITVETISALQNAAKASKTTMSEMDIDNVDKVLADISDTADQMQQIQEAMGQPLGAAADLDEDELEAELQEMEASEMDRELLRPAPVPSTRLPAAGEAEAAMPSAPTRPVPAAKAKTAEELELEALEAEFS